MAAFRMLRKLTPENVCFVCISQRGNLAGLGSPIKSFFPVPRFLLGDMRRRRLDEEESGCGPEIRNASGNERPGS